MLFALIWIVLKLFLNCTVQFVLDLSLNFSWSLFELSLNCFWNVPKLSLNLPWFKFKMFLICPWIAHGQNYPQKGLIKYIFEAKRGPKPLRQKKNIQFPIKSVSMYSFFFTFCSVSGHHAPLNLLWIGEKGEQGAQGDIDPKYFYCERNLPFKRSLT